MGKKTWFHCRQQSVSLDTQELDVSMAPAGFYYFQGMQCGWGASILNSIIWFGFVSLDRNSLHYDRLLYHIISYIILSYHIISYYTYIIILYNILNIIIYMIKQLEQLRAIQVMYAMHETHATIKQTMQLEVSENMTIQ